MAPLDLLNQKLGHFEILSELGRGGMGVVYKARQTTLNRIVALKVLPPELSLDANYIARFEREAQNAARLEHANIIPIYEVGEANNMHYIAMRYIDGETLREVMQREGAMRTERAIELLTPICAALDYAHNNQVIHRDIKPSNIMISRDGTLYLADFGLAREMGATSGLTVTGMVMGTPDYMSPEQAQGLPNIGPPTDIYAMGIILYQMLTGNLPFESSTPMGMVSARVMYAPKPPTDFRSDIPPEVEDVVMQTLARKPEARYQRAGEMIRQLRRAVNLSTPAQGVPTYAFPPDQISHPHTPTPMPYVGHPPTPYSHPPTPHSHPSTPQRHPPTPQSHPPTPQSHPPTPQGYTPTAYSPPTPLPSPASGPAPKSDRKRGPGLFIGLGIGGGLLLIVIVAAVSFIVSFSNNTASNLIRPPTSAATTPADELAASGDSDVARLLQEGTEALQRRGGMDDAITAYQQVLEREPDNVTALSQLAFIHSLRFHYKRTEELARAAIDADPKAAFAYVVLADALDDHRETFDEARDALNQAITLAPDLSFAYAIRAETRAGLAHDTNDNEMLQQAIADADRAIELANNEDNLMKALAHSARGSVYNHEYLMTEDQTKLTLAVEEFNKAIGLQNQIAYFAARLGDFYNQQARDDLDRGREEEAKQKFDLAVQKFQEALTIDPSYAHAHNGLGWNAFYRDDYARALEEFDRAIAIDPANVDAFFGKNAVYRNQDPPNYEMAIDVLNQAAAVAPQNDQVLSWMGWTYLDQGEVGAATEQFRQALQLNPNSAEAHSGLGWAAYRQNDYEEAETHFRRVLELAPNSAEAHTALGWSLGFQHKYAEAERHLRRAIELSPSNLDAYLGLASVLEETDRPDEARQMYEKVLELDPDNQNARSGVERVSQ